MQKKQQFFCMWKKYINEQKKLNGHCYCIRDPLRKNIRKIGLHKGPKHETPVLFVKNQYNSRFFR